MRLRRPRLRWRIAAALLGLAFFALLSLPPMGRDFGRVYGSAKSSLHVYRYSDCYMIAEQPNDGDARRDEPDAVVVLGTTSGPPSDESFVWSRFVIESLFERRDAPKARSDNDARPPWYGVRLVPWKGSQAILVEPGKLRWFALALIAPLALGLIRAGVRRRRRRRGACMHCGYSLFGCPSPRCPECGDTVPIASAAAPSSTETGAP